MLNLVFSKLYILVVYGCKWELENVENLNRKCIRILEILNWNNYKFKVKRKVIKERLVYVFKWWV